MKQFYNIVLSVMLFSCIPMQAIVMLDSGMASEFSQTALQNSLRAQLLGSVQRGNVAMVRHLLEAGVDIDSETSKKFTYEALMLPAGQSKVMLQLFAPFMALKSPLPSGLTAEQIALVHAYKMFLAGKPDTLKQLIFEQYTIQTPGNLATVFEPENITPLLLWLAKVS